MRELPKESFLHLLLQKMAFRTEESKVCIAAQICWSTEIQLYAMFPFSIYFHKNSMFVDGAAKETF